MANVFDEPIRRYHPLFESSDADIKLLSNERTLYRIPSFTLRNTSGMFRKLLPPIPIPSSGQGAEQIEGSIFVDEKDNVLERVLRMISGLETLKWESFDQLEDVTSLVESWDAQGPLSIIRSAITSPFFLAEPLRLYVLAMHFGWEEEAKIASTHTLTYSLYDEKHRATLQRLSAKHLMALLGLHRRRRDEFKRYINGEDIFNTGNDNQFNCACGEERDNHTWRELKFKMFVEMDRRPLGDTLTGLDIEEWPESLACWAAKCTNEACGKPNYNKLKMLRVIKDCISRLPSTVD